MPTRSNTESFWNRVASILVREFLAILFCAIVLFGIGWAIGRFL